MDYNNVANTTKQRIRKAMQKVSQEQLVCQVHGVMGKLVSSPYPLVEAISNGKLNVIGDIRRNNPYGTSVKNANFSHTKYAIAYQNCPVSAISVTTEPDFHDGENYFIDDVRAVTALPIIRNDFIISPYQIYYSKLRGASAVDLISAIMTPKKLNEFITLLHTLNMSAVVNVFSKQTLMISLEAGARIICVDNLDPRTGIINYDSISRLREYIPDNVTVIVRNALETAESIQQLKKIKVNAVIMSDKFMRTRAKINYLNSIGFTNI